MTAPYVIHAPGRVVADSAEEAVNLFREFERDAALREIEFDVEPGSEKAGALKGIVAMSPRVYHTQD